MVTALLVFAMPTERAPLVRRLAARRSGIGGIPVRLGAYGGREVVAIVTGMGTALAASGTNGALDALAADGRTVERVLVVGICGGVDTTAIGTLVSPAAVVNSNTGASFEPTAPGPSTAPRGELWTTDVLTPPAEVRALVAERGVVGLDMETAAVAEVCAERGVPWAVFRAISDRPDDAVDEAVLAMSNQDGTPNVGNVVRYVLRHPERVPHLARMGRNVRLATTTAVDAALASLSRPLAASGRATSLGTPGRGAP